MVINLISKGLISKKEAALIIVDVQEKLFPLVYERNKVLDNIRKLIRFAKIINMPIVLTEQYPRGLGLTIPEIKEIIPEIQPIEKVEFSCFGSEKFRSLLNDLNVKTLIITGIETHICVAQTSIEGLNNGYKSCVIVDATSSRNPEDKSVALERMKQSGVIIASTEMIIYELLGTAGTQEFREVLKLIKS